MLRRQCSSSSDEEDRLVICEDEEEIKKINEGEGAQSRAEIELNKRTRDSFSAWAQQCREAAQALKERQQLPRPVAVYPKPRAQRRKPHKSVSPTASLQPPSPPAPPAPPTNTPRLSPSRSVPVSESASAVSVLVRCPPSRRRLACDESDEHIGSFSCVQCTESFKAKVLSYSFQNLAAECDFLKDVAGHCLTPTTQSTSAFEIMRTIQLNICAASAVLTKKTPRSYIYARTVLEAAESSCNMLIRGLYQCSTEASRTTMMDICLYANRYHLPIIHYLTSARRLKHTMDELITGWEIFEPRLNYEQCLSSWISDSCCARLIVWNNFLPTKLKFVAAVLSMSPQLRDITGFSRLLCGIKTEGLSLDEIAAIIPQNNINFIPSAAALTGVLRGIRWEMPPYPVGDEEDSPSSTALYQAIYKAHNALYVSVEDAYGCFKLYNQRPSSIYRHSVATIIMRCICDHIPMAGMRFDKTSSTGLMLAEMLRSSLGADALSFAPIAREEWSSICGVGLSKETLNAMMLKLAWPTDVDWFAWFVSGDAPRLLSLSQPNDTVSRIVSSALVMTRGPESLSVPTLEAWMDRYGSTGSVPVDLLHM
ncbi:protein ORF56 [Cyprinid herpesvirus 1]|uniref:Protein ORF56 n=1 Tax=Cyprinid herpesvirus 1 TaxID=317858 RepID=K7PBL2_9VIRU|nr:protein ORF56 [Cyprinid herpesvirus 1]AFJ20356.1 protein ORF56 [Cyprinid herpesvirus 1]